jgi:hypothetical protein
MLTFPFMMIGSVSLAWKLQERRNFGMALLITLLPVVQLAFSHAALAPDLALFGSR